MNYRIYIYIYIYIYIHCSLETRGSRYPRIFQGVFFGARTCFVCTALKGVRKLFHFSWSEKLASISISNHTLLTWRVWTYDDRVSFVWLTAMCEHMMAVSVLFGWQLCVCVCVCVHMTPSCVFGWQLCVYIWCLFLWCLTDSYVCSAYDAVSVISDWQLCVCRMTVSLRFDWLPCVYIWCPRPDIWLTAMCIHMMHMYMMFNGLLCVHRMAVSLRFDWRLCVWIWRPCSWCLTDGYACEYDAHVRDVWLTAMLMTFRVKNSQSANKFRPIIAANN